MTPTTILIMFALALLICIAIIALFGTPQGGDEYNRLLQIGNDYRTKGFFVAAIETYGRASAIKPRDYRAYEGKGSAYIILHEYKKAIDELDMAIKYKRNSAILYTLRARAYAETKASDKAIEDYLHAIKLKEDDETYSYLSLVYYNLERFNEAVQSITKAIALNSEEEEHYILRGNYNYSLKEFKAAIEDYTKALTLKSNNTKVFNARGLAYLKLKDYPKAILDFEELVKASPEDPIAVFNLGTAYMRQNLLEKAVESFDKLLLIMPKDKIAIKNLAMIKRKMGQLEEAENHISNAISSNQEDGSLYLVQAEIFLAQHNIEKFYESFEQASKLGGLIEYKFDDPIYISVKNEERFKNLIKQ